MLVVNDENDMDKDEVIPILKIGYSEDSRGNGRFNDYMSNGLVIRVIKTIPGGSWNLEHTLQRKFKDYKLPGKSIEWFYYTDEIVQLFLKCNNDVDLYSLFGATDEEELRKVQYESRSSNYKLAYDLSNGLNMFLNDFPNNTCQVKILEDLLDTPRFSEKMRILCNLPEKDLDIILPYLPEDMVLFYNVLGPERIKALEYRREYLIKEINNLKKRCDNSTIEKIVQTFKVGERYSRNVIKEELSKIYSDLDITKAPKASDLLEYFEIREVNMPREDGSGKRDKGYEILGFKKNN